MKKLPTSLFALPALAAGLSAGVACAQATDAARTVPNSPSVATACAPVANGTSFDSAIARQSCANARLQERMNQWDSEQDARAQRIQDLQKRIADAPADQKAMLQSQLNTLTSGYTNRLQALQNDQEAQEARLRSLKAQYANLPEAEKARVRGRLDAQTQQLNKYRNMQNQQTQQWRDLRTQNQQTVRDLKDIGKNLLKGW